MTTRTILAALLALNFVPLAACSGADVADELEEEAPIDGKLDSFRAPTDNGNINFAEAGYAELTADAKFHVWTFEVSGDADASIETRKDGDRAVDTVLYLYKQNDNGGWGSYLERDDDGGTDKASKLSDVDLSRGTYRILVKGKRASTRGAFQVEVLCGGAGCYPAAAPPPPNCTVAAADEARAAYLTAWEEDQLQNLDTIEHEDLPGDVGRYADSLSREWLGEYQPIAYRLPLASGHAIALELSHDGGMQVDVFDAQGFLLADGGASESSEFGWGEDPCWLSHVKAKIDARVETGEAVEGVTRIQQNQMPDYAADDIEQMLALYGSDDTVSYVKIESDGLIAFAMIADTDGDVYVRLFDSEGFAMEMAYPYGPNLMWTTDTRLETPDSE